MISKRKIWFLVAGTVTAVVAAFTAVVLYNWKLPQVRPRLIQVLSEQLDSDVRVRRDRRDARAARSRSPCATS